MADRRRHHRGRLPPPGQGPDDITGACWGLDGAEAVLRLRALTSNGDFDTYWTWHLTREHHRTHLTHYQDHTLAA
jgi:hypothetical protein